MPGKKHQAVIYARFSPRRYAHRCESNERQIELCRAWCKARELDVLEVFSESSVSARTLARPYFQRAIDMVCYHRCSLVALNMERVYRGTVGFAELLEKLRKYRASLILVQDGFDTSTEIGEAMAKMAAILGELDRRRKARVTSDAMKQLQANGKIVSAPGRLPLGYRVDRHSKINEYSALRTMMERDPEELAAIGQVIQIRDSLRAEGKGWPFVAEELERLEIDVRGTSWTVGRARHVYKRGLALVEEGLIELTPQSA